MKLTLRVYLRFNLIFFCSFIHQLKDPESLKSHVQELFPDQVKRKIVITYMLFAGWEVRIVKNCDLGLEDTPQFSKRTYLTIPGWRCCHRRRSGQVARPCEWARLAEMEAGTRKCEFHSYCLSRHEVTHYLRCKPARQTWTLQAAKSGILIVRGSLGFPLIGPFGFASETRFLWCGAKFGTHPPAERRDERSGHTAMGEFENRGFTLKTH